MPHRGIWGKYDGKIIPENSLAALQKTHELGFRSLELDAQTTKDGHLVVAHDRVVDRILDLP
ncbi:glycerophosphodiester phosphodiesterase family protein [uncultured Tateyamaria sp.]|uniref:glycerophosphodiester phosphodiesterase n=1 Tax=uncultured Tateyamaria sp. TaxID=455651 RepID=UPI00344D42E4